MLSYTDLQKGTAFILDGEPYEVLEYNFLRMQQRKPVVQTKIKNLNSGKIIEKTFRQNDNLKEAEIIKKEVVFIYSHRGEFWFRYPKDPKNRFLLPENIIGDSAKFLKENISVTIAEFKGKPISISLPVKMEFVVKQAPPGVKGNTAQGGTKTVTLENGLELAVPLFINPGDVIRLNTQTGQYVERVEKGC
jgi:elongation factor P